MTSRTKRTLISIQVLSGFLLLIIFGIGIFSREISKKIVEQANRTGLENHLQRRVGEVFIQQSQVEIARIREEERQATTSFAEAFGGFGQLNLNIGGVVVLLNGFCIFLLVREPVEVQC